MKDTLFEIRLRGVLSLFILGLGLMFFRLFYLQVVLGENLRDVAEANRSSLITEHAPRGHILDRNGLFLADNKPTFVILFSPGDLKRDVINDVIKRLSKILNLDEKILREKLKPAIERSTLVRIMDRVSRYTAFALAEQQPNLPGVSVVIEMQRRYPNGSLASHVMGYLGRINTKELEELRGLGYKSDWLIGKIGLEKEYDNELRGEDGGMRIEVDVSGRSLKIIDEKEPNEGFRVVTTLDLRIQYAAERALAKTHKAGAVVAMNPQNGEILAFASSPSFDPNIFVYTRGEQAEEIDPSTLFKRRDLPFFNRPIQGTYAPGSIFKIIDTAAALESKEINPEERIKCRGYYVLGGKNGKKFLCWKKKGHGRMNLSQALANSCNVYYYNIGLKLGPNPIEGLARKFSLGEPTGLKLPGEVAGIIPGRTMFKKGEIRRWYDGDTLNMVIGQGSMLLTPIQAARMISVVASRGKLFEPILVREISMSDGRLFRRSEKKLVRQIKLAQSTWDFLESSLTEVVESGTGRACQIPGVKVAGKTGTAQNPHGDDHAWFVAYAPLENPMIALAVLVEHGEHGASSAAPIAREVILAAQKSLGFNQQAQNAKDPMTGEQL